MQSFTYCSEEGTNAVIESLPHKYPMELNRSDMTNLVRVLADAWNTAESTEQSDWAGDFLSSIAQTLNVEFI